MWRPVIGVLSVAGLLLPLGCRQDEEPAPLYLSEAGVDPLPVRIPPSIRDKASIVWSAAGENEKPASKPVGTDAPVAINDSTPQALVESFKTLLAAGQLSRLPDLLVEEQQEAARAIAKAAQPLVTANIELKQALDGKFAGHAVQLQLDGELAALETLLKSWTIANVEAAPANATTTTATLTAEGNASMTLTLKKLGNRWRIDLPNMIPANAVAAVEPMAAKLADALKDTSARVQDGEFADAAAADARIKELVRNPEAAPPAPKKSAVAARPKRPGPAKPQAQPQEPRSKSELEQQMDSATGRSAMGGI